MPNFPKEGVFVASSDHTDQTHNHPIGYEKLTKNNLIVLTQIYNITTRNLSIHFMILLTLYVILGKKLGGFKNEITFTTKYPLCRNIA